jgi:azurin
MKKNPILIFLGLAIAGLTPLANAGNAPAKTISISAFDTMKYSVMKFEVSPGQKVTVELKNEGNVPKIAMGHNWILLKAGVDPVSYANAAITAKAEDFQPKALSDKVLASIPMLGPKESAKVTFTAPMAPGTYAYLCSFPAHTQAGMRGVMIVK